MNFWGSLPILTKRLCTSVLWMAVVLPAAVSADNTASVNWLATQPNADGSFGNTPASLAAPIQSTAEVLRAYQALGETAQPSFGPALTFLNNDTEINTEFLSRKIIVNAEVGNAVTPLVDALLTHQNIDGGFGERPEEGSSIFNTAFALEALALTNRTSGTQVARALGFLISRQQADGGWAIEDNGADNAQPTHAAIATGVRDDGVILYFRSSDGPIEAPRLRKRILRYLLGRVSSLKIPGPTTVSIVSRAG